MTATSGSSSQVRMQVRRTARDASPAPLDLRSPSGRQLPF
jgi:hypothetical protein